MSLAGVDVIDGVVEYGAISVTTTPVKIQSSSSPLSTRQALLIQPLDEDIYIGYDNTVTSTTGERFFQSQTTIRGYPDTIEVWAVTASGTADVRFAEIA